MVKIYSRLDNRELGDECFLAIGADPQDLDIVFYVDEAEAVKVYLSDEEALNLISEIQKALSLQKKIRANEGSADELFAR